MLRTLRNVAISAVVLVIIAGVAGVAYVLLTGGQNASVKSEQAPAPQPEPPGLPKPHKPNPNNPESAGIQALTSPVKPGENSSMTVQTQPTSTCTISATYNNVPSKDSGLTPKTADDYGSVTWSWTVDPSAPEGTWPVKVTCVFNKKSAVVIGNLQISKK